MLGCWVLWLVQNIFKFCYVFSHFFLGTNLFKGLISCILICVCGLVSQLCSTLCDPMDCSLPRLLCPWDFPSKNTEVGCRALLQGIFPTQGLNLASVSPALGGGFLTTEPPGKPGYIMMNYYQIWFSQHFHLFSQLFSRN